MSQVKSFFKVSTLDGWNKHTCHHWSRELNGYRLDYWPTKHKYRYKIYNNSKSQSGCVDDFIKSQMQKSKLKQK